MYWHSIHLENVNQQLPAIYDERKRPPTKDTHWWFYQVLSTTDRTAPNRNRTLCYQYHMSRLFFAAVMPHCWYCPSRFTIRHCLSLLQSVTSCLSTHCCLCMPAVEMYHWSFQTLYCGPENAYVCICFLYYFLESYLLHHSCKVTVANHLQILAWEFHDRETWWWLQSSVI